MADQEKLAQLVVQMELQSAAFERGVKEMARKMDGLDREAAKVNKSFGKLDKTFTKIGRSLAGLAASVSVLGIAAATKEAIEFADGIAKTADKVGVSVEALQKLRFAAGQAGVEATTLDMALQRFARRAGEAAQGTGELVKVFDELGISTSNVDGSLKSTEQLLYEYADAIGDAEGAQEKLRLAFKGFDSEGAALVNLFREGSGAVKELGDELERAGGLLSEEAARAAEVANDKFDKLSTVIKAKVTTAFVEATEAALEFFGVFLDADPAKLRLKELNAELARLQDKLVNGPARSRNATSQQIRKLKEEIADLEEQIKKLTGKDTETAVTSASETPLTPLKRDITGLDEDLDLVAAAMRRVREEVEGIGAAALKAAEPSIFASGGFLDQLNESINPSATDNAISSLENLADIGVVFDDVADSGEDAMERLIQATDGFAREFTQTLTQSLLDGEARFDDFAKNVLKTIADILLNEIFSEFFSTIAGGIKGFFGASTASATPEGRITAYAPMSVPSLTREGEVAPSMIVGRVQPSRGFVSTSSSPVTVNVNNYGNDTVEVDQRNTANGIEIDVLIKNTVKNGLADGSFDRVMSASFGARRLAY